MLIMLINIHDSVHYFTVHISGEVLTGRQLDISYCKIVDIRSEIIL